MVVRVRSPPPSNTCWAPRPVRDVSHLVLGHHLRRWHWRCSKWSRTLRLFASWLGGSRSGFRALPQTVGPRLLRLLSGLGTPPVQERGCSTLLRRLPPSSPFFLLSFPSFLSPLLQPNHLNQPGLGSPYYRHFRPFSLPRQNGSVQGETLRLYSYGSFPLGSPPTSAAKAIPWGCLASLRPLKTPLSA